MKIKIDARPQVTKLTEQSEAFFAIRLYPETNKEMAGLDWGENLFQVEKFEKQTFLDHLSYAILFERKK